MTHSHVRKPLWAAVVQYLKLVWVHQVPLFVQDQASTQDQSFLQHGVFAG